MSDQFFEEEGSPEEARPEATKADASGGKGQGRTKKPSSSGAAARDMTARRPAEARAKGGAGSSATRKPPSFGLVIAIAIVALLLGFALGYYTALGAMSHRIEELYAGYDTMGASAHADAVASAATDAQASGDLNAQADLPEGHPDLSSLLNDDGSVNEEALAQYKAEQAQQSDAQE